MMASPKKLPSLQFYPGDWMKDPALRACSLAARGLWIDTLCLMFEAPRRGHLAHRTGSPVTTEQLARMVGSSVDEVERLLLELSSCGVLSRTADGVLFSRRMERDEHRRQVNVENGRKGGNPSLTSDNRNSNQTTNRGGIPPDNRKQTPSSSASASNTRPEAGGRENDWTRPSVGALKSTPLLMEWLTAEAPKAGNPDLTESFRVSVIAAALRAIDQGDDAPKLFASLFMELLDGKITKLNQYRKKAEAKYREWKPAE